MSVRHEEVQTPDLTALIQVFVEMPETEFQARLTHLNGSGEVNDEFEQAAIRQAEEIRKERRV